jgi:hypothetical protein
VAVLCAATVLAEALSPAGLAIAAATAPPSAASAATPPAQHHPHHSPDPSKDPLRAFFGGMFGGDRKRREEAERLERERLEEEARAAAAAAEAKAAAAAAASRGPWWRRVVGRGGGGNGSSSSSAPKQQPPEQQQLTATDLADLLSLELERAEQLLNEDELPPAALRLTPQEASGRIDRLARALRLGGASARAVVARTPALLALEPGWVRQRVDRDLPEVLGLSRERAAEAARASPGLILAGARLGGGDEGDGATKQQPPSTATLYARLRALAALLEVPEPVARDMVAARCPELLALPRVDLAGRLALLGRVLSEPERAQTQAAAEAALARQQRRERDEEEQQQSASSGRRERRSRSRAKARLEEETRELRARDASRRLPPFSQEGLQRARAASLEAPSLLALAGRPTTLRLRAREAAVLLGLSSAQLCDVITRQGGAALLSQPTALTRARLLAVGLLLDASPPDAADAVARTPTLVAVTGDELAARLGAVSETLKVPLARARTLALERPSLLARDVPTIRAAGELVSKAAKEATRR